MCLTLALVLLLSVVRLFPSNIVSFTTKKRSAIILISGHRIDSLGILFCLAMVVLVAASAEASPYIGVGDEIYNILARLEAEGVIKSGLLNTKPISRKEAIRLLSEAEKNSEGRSEFVKELV